MPKPKPTAVPSAARYQPGARRRRVRVISAPSEGTPRARRAPPARACRRSRAGMMSGVEALRRSTLFGSTIDCRGCRPRRACEMLSRSGPTVPLAFAAAERVAAAAAVGGEDRLAVGAPPPPPPPLPRRRRLRRRRGRAARPASVASQASNAAAGHHAHVLAHRRVADAAQLGAHHLVAADAVGRQADLGGEARHGVRLEPELGHPEGVEHVLRLDAELHRAVLRQHQLGATSPSRSGYSKVQVNCCPVTFTTSWFGLLGLDVVEHDPAVDRRAR